MQQLRPVRSFCDEAEPLEQLGPPIDDVPPHELIPESADGELDHEPQASAAADFVTPLQWPKGDPPPVSWVVHNKIPRCDVTTLGGDGGSGKTMAALQLSTALARGAGDWLGYVIEPGPAVFLSGEEPNEEIWRRAARVARRQGFDLAELGNLHLWFPSDYGSCALATPGAGGVMQATPLLRSIEAAVCAIRPALVVLDNVAATFPGDQNNRVMVRTFVNLWRGMARASGAAVLLLDHPSLSGITNGTGRGGNMDWRNSVRSALHLKPAEDRDDATRGVRLLECVKNNYAPLGEAMRLEWVDGVLAPEGTVSPTRRAASEFEAEEVFLRLLDERNAQGRHVGVNSGANYAPAVFAAADGGKPYTRQAFARVMERLFKAGRVKLATSGPPSKQRQHLIRGEAG